MRRRKQKQKSTPIKKRCLSIKLLNTHYNIPCGGTAHEAARRRLLLGNKNPRKVETFIYRFFSRLIPYYVEDTITRVSSGYGRYEVSKVSDCTVCSACPESQVEESDSIVTAGPGDYLPSSALDHQWRLRGRICLGRQLIRLVTTGSSGARVSHRRWH